MRRAIVSLAALTAMGCSMFLGKSYSRFNHVPGGMGAIYIYSGNISTLQHVHVDREPETNGITHTISMIGNGYFAYLAPPGLVRVLSGPPDAPDCVLIAVQADSHHWVRASKASPRVVALGRAAAEVEIAGHREISSESREAGAGSYVAKDCPLAELDP